MTGVSAPGLILAFSGDTARFEPMALSGGIANVGWRWMETLRLGDSALSREHARVTRTDNDWVVEDLDSRNGTFADGRRVVGTLRGDFSVLRVASTLFLLEADICPCALLPHADRGRCQSRPRAGG